ncbi:carboxyl transferase [Stackebrandtia nassauensis DSM 44728]|uniref:Carboxyl transferase n=2 Tax=Stackebrandtia TaxID=283810 RepID=D3Q8L1_STANL|nr:carboxyl transferase domain-containing protein [Stackebrandtia nassauensis]ADD44453.1 carboxyl transferase [Stackebrandtia nassauensis DSM 44728]
MSNPTVEAEQEVVDVRDPMPRLTALFDTGTISLLHSGDDSGVVTARGDIAGSPAIAYCSDARVKGGAIGIDGGKHIVDAIDTAVRERIPVIGVWHSGGARLAEGVTALHAIGEIFAAMVRASGRVPQISVVLGPAAGGAAYGPALTDIVIMSNSGRIFVTGPEVVKSVTGEQSDMETLGGPDVHGKKSGVAHITTKDDATAFATARDLASLLGRPGRFEAADADDSTDLGALLPEQANRAYNVKPLVKKLLDSGEGVESPVEMHGKWAASIVTVLGRFAGRTVGVIANNPLKLGGCLNSESAEKSARFVRMCDSLGIPLIVLVDVPGYLPGLGQEWDGVVRRGAKLLHAFAESVVPRVTLVTRKSYGGAYIAMNSRSLGATAVFAWPTAEVAVMGASAAVNVLHRKKLAAVPAEERDALREKLIADHENEAGGVSKAIDIGVVDEVIEPSQTRFRIAQALASAPPARGAHGNIPL